MIISASRRTDIPAFYSEWFMNRIRAGYCTVPNPFNPNMVSHVSLKPEDVDVIVFWTRYPRPMFSHLRELEELGYRYYFLYTVLNNPRFFRPQIPAAQGFSQDFPRTGRPDRAEKGLMEIRPHRVHPDKREVSLAQ